MSRFKLLASAFLGLITGVCLSAAQTWTPLANKPNFNAAHSLLLTDGRILCQDSGTSNWWLYSPSAKGSYVNGTWAKAASTGAYAPLYYASAVLKDGRVIVVGGEYLHSNVVNTNQGAIYDPVANKWQAINAPWPNLGNAQCAVLADGSFMLGHDSDGLAAVLNPSLLTWSPIGSGKVDRFKNESWALLPNGDILTCDALNAPQTERFTASTHRWTSAGSTQSSLPQHLTRQLGPMVRCADGSVLAVGASGHNAVYKPVSPTAGGWWAAPDFPTNAAGVQLDCADGPACLLPSGNVLVAASPGVFNPGTAWFEWNGAGWKRVTDRQESSIYPTYPFEMLMLPTGQVWVTSQDSTVEIYTPTGAPKPGWAPRVVSAQGIETAGSTYLIEGTQFNGLSQCSAYGDSNNNATNYPLVRLTNTATGTVAYARTFNHSTMGVATGSALVTTNFTVPMGLGDGYGTLQVVANGIPSNTITIILKSH